MRTSSVAIAPRVLLLDTGPLWELILFSAVRDLHFKRLERELHFIRNPMEHKRLREFISRFRTKTTTPHVVAEISRKTRETERRGHARIWDLVYREFRSTGLDERLIRLLDMPQPLVEKFGVADAGILSFGLSILSERPLVLSVDSELVSECLQAKIEAMLLWDIVSGVNP